MEDEAFGHRREIRHPEFQAGEHQNYLKQMDCDGHLLPHLAPPRPTGTEIQPGTHIWSDCSDSFGSWTNMMEGIGLLLGVCGGHELRLWVGGGYAPGADD